MSKVRLDQSQNCAYDGIVRVLFLNAKYNAAGLNLNATTDIVITNNTNSLNRVQLIDRTQRPVGSSTLVVHECTPRSSA